MESSPLPGTLPRLTPASGDTGSKARSPGTKQEAQSKPTVQTENTMMEQLQAAATQVPPHPSLLSRPGSRGQSGVSGDLRFPARQQRHPPVLLERSPPLLGKRIPHCGASWLGHVRDTESKMSLCPPVKEPLGPGGWRWRQPWRDTPLAVLRARFSQAT